MTIVCIKRDIFGYFPPGSPKAIPAPSRDKLVSFYNPIAMRVSALFALFCVGVSPSFSKRERERCVYISNNSGTRMVAGLQAETALSPLWCKKGSA